MKAKYCFSAALMALALWGCTSDNLVVDDTSVATVAPGEKGYINLSISLPTTPVTSTKADAPDVNDQFDNGDVAEYTVNDAYLLLFAGDDDDEASATFHSLYDLNIKNDGWTTEESNDQITKYKGIVQEITKPGNEYIYGLVVLNKTGILEVMGTGVNSEGYFGDVELTQGGTTLSDLRSTSSRADIADIADRSGNNFFMTNAPLSTVQGGYNLPEDVKIKTLVSIADIYPTKEEAVTGNTASFYVERGVAKVTVIDGRDGDEKAKESEIYDSGFNDGYEIQGFILDNTNPQMYPVRNPVAIGQATSDNWWTYYNSNTYDGTSDYVGTTHPYDKYRFIGYNSVESGVSLYRTYWAFDPNYDVNNSEAEVSLTSLAGTTPTLSQIGSAYPLYCLENTFDVKHMRQENTTRAIIAVKLAGSTFYTCNGGEEHYSDVNQIRAMIYNEDPDLSVVRTLTLIGDAMEKWKNGLWDICWQINVLYKDYGWGGIVTFTLELPEVEDSGFSDYNGTYSPAWQAVKDDLAKGYTVGGEDNSEILTELNERFVVYEYVNGVAYFPVLIKHFGDELTPWTEDEIVGGNSYAGNGNESTNYDENPFLGRYGVLRNNWYEIEVKSITGNGYPAVPEPEDNYDDPAASWISAKINILSWAVRKQTVTL